jgi:hypothetical protein
LGWPREEKRGRLLPHSTVPATTGARHNPPTSKMEPPRRQKKKKLEAVSNKKVVHK